MTGARRLEWLTQITAVATLTITMSIISVVTKADESPRLGPSVNFRHGDLKVSSNHRYLIHADGTPFFYLGDTAWELFHRLTREEADRYLENRRQKGFTVIQAVVLAEFDGLKVPNPYGETPLINNDPTQPTKPLCTESA